MSRAAPDSSGVVFPPPVIYLLGLVVGWLLDAWYPLGRIPDTIRWVLGVALGVAGLGIMLPALRLIRRAGTAINPTKPTTRLVLGGAVPLHAEPPLPVAPADLRGDRCPHECHLGTGSVASRDCYARPRRDLQGGGYLEPKFGDEYRGYRAQVRPWI
jgi:hypothetical protein